MAPGADMGIDGARDGNVQVVCRVRPPDVTRGAGGVQRHASSCVADGVAVVGKTVEVMDNKGGVSRFQFADVLGPTSCQSDVYEVAAWELVEGVLAGYDGALLCYGQTGSGKTYTLEGSLDDWPQAGILPRAAHHIFEGARQLSDNVVVKVSFVEIYMEKVQDLLADRASCGTPSLGVRDLDGRGPRVQGCREVEVDSLKDLLRLARLGSSNRHVATTRMNDRSSRSHSIFSITVAHIDPEDGRMFTGTLHLVDLAGSERQLLSHSEGQRLAEARTINRSLSTLGDVIAALAPTHGDRREALNHVPYRNSKLTWLLREALGGSAQAVLVLTISPAMVDRPETLSSLRFGSRAMRVCNQPAAHIGAAVSRSTEGSSASEEDEEEELLNSLKLRRSTSASTASTASLDICSTHSGCAADEASDAEHEIDLLADALAQAFGCRGGVNFDSRDFAERFLAMREQVASRNSQLLECPPPCRYTWVSSQVTLPRRPRRWHASIAWDFAAGGTPKLRAQLFEACDGEESCDHRLMMEMSAEEFSALPVSPWGRW